jgi:hypothetical protein
MIRKTFSASLVIVIAVFGLTLASPLPADAAAKKFSSCAKLHLVYPNGIARDQASIDLAVGLTRIPTINKRVYKANYSRLDRDRDGIACEV